VSFRRYGGHEKVKFDPSTSVSAEETRMKGSFILNIAMYVQLVALYQYRVREGGLNEGP
jgi:hypothetical protein